MKNQLFLLTIVILGLFNPLTATAGDTPRMIADESTATTRTRHKVKNKHIEVYNGNFDLIHFRLFPLVDLEVNEFRRGPARAPDGPVDRYTDWSLLTVPFFHFAGIQQPPKQDHEASRLHRLEPFMLSSKPDFMAVDFPLFSLLEVHSFPPDRSTVSVLDSPLLNVWRQERYQGEIAHYVGATPLINLYADACSPTESEFGLLDLPLLGWMFRHKVTAENNTVYFFCLHFSYSKS